MQNQVRINQTEQYKETELGLLPKHWNIVKSQSLLILNDAGIWGDECQEIKNCTDVLRSTNIQKNKWVFDDVARRKINKKEFERCWLREGDILIVKSSGSKEHIGKCAYVDKEIEKREVVFANFMQRLRFKSSIYSKYAFYYMSTIGKRELLKSSTTTTGLRNLKKIDFESIIFPIPPINEQQSIAYILSTIQEAGEKTENVINSLKELKKSMMKHLFTYGAVSFEDAEKVKLKDTEIGKVPEDWGVVKLGDVFDVQQGKQLSSKESTEGKIKIPFLRTSNVFWGKIDILNIDYMFFTEKEFKKLQLKNNDILICEGGDIGRTAIWHEEINKCAYQNHLHRLRPIKDYSPQFLGLWMEHAIINNKMYIQNANRTTIPNLSSSRLKDFDLPKPSATEQQQIASILSVVDEKIESEENKKKALDELFKSMLHNLMTAKIRVNDLELA